jgi:hypothetical protein
MERGRQRAREGGSGSPCVDWGGAKCLSKRRVREGGKGKKLLGGPLGLFCLQMPWQVAVVAGA